jgi:hypothetical protein
MVVVIQHSASGFHVTTARNSFRLVHDDAEEDLEHLTSESFSDEAVRCLQNSGRLFVAGEPCYKVTFRLQIRCIYKIRSGRSIDVLKKDYEIRPCNVAPLQKVCGLLRRTLNAYAFVHSTHGPITYRRDCCRVGAGKSIVRTTFRGDILLQSSSKEAACKGLRSRITEFESSACEIFGVYTVHCKVYCAATEYRAEPDSFNDETGEGESKQCDEVAKAKKKRKRDKWKAKQKAKKKTKT